MPPETSSATLTDKPLCPRHHWITYMHEASGISWCCGTFLCCSGRSYSKEYGKAPLPVGTEGLEIALILAIVK